MVISVLESSWKWENVLLFLSASVEKHLYSNKYNCLLFFFIQNIDISHIEIEEIEEIEICLVISVKWFLIQGNSLV